MTPNIAEKLARQAILELKPYSSAREEFTGNEGIFLDANESPYNKPLNRYPDPTQQKLRQGLSEMKGVEVQNVILGNGSDETIDMLYRCFCEPGKDKVLAISPTYGMYKVSADIIGVEYESILLNEDLSLPVAAILEKSDTRAKMLFLCTPNNPTGNSFAKEDMKTLIEKFPGLVVVDEAYIDFSQEGSWVDALREYPNLVVLQTLSKAWGLAGIRLGMAFASEDIIRLMMKVKPPYNINTLTQQKALQALSQADLTTQRVTLIREQRDRLMAGLSNISMIQRVYASDANFFLVKVAEPQALYDFLLKCGIIVRNRSSQPCCEGCLRISVGTPAQNDYLLEAVKRFDAGNTNPPDPQKIRDLSDWLIAPPRTALVERKTNETNIRVVVNLDGTAQSAVSTGLGFLDHMLAQIARHSGCDLNIRVKGDLEVDEHHTMEDTAIALGEAFAAALGNKLGIDRYGFALPMDDCAALVLLDFGGRPELIWKAKFKREKIGELPTEMFSHFFKSFAIGARCNLHIKARGKNEHHKIEAIFKALARALRMAIRREASAGILPSTKGVL